jgi:hypothetical protein
MYDYDICKRLYSRAHSGLEGPEPTGERGRYILRLKVALESRADRGAGRNNMDKGIGGEQALLRLVGGKRWPMSPS